MQKSVVLAALGAFIIVGAGVAWAVTAPKSLDTEAVIADGDRDAGRMVFAAAGCGSCHVASDIEGDGPPILAGGQAFETEFGTFYAPNISSDPEQGIGGWTDYEIVNAIQAGVSPENAHYYPAFPYTSYANASAQDMADLVAYLRTLPADATPSRAHELSFPFNIRRSLGGWKVLYGDRGWVVTGDLDDQVERGRYLVEGLGHCAECHTPRTALGGLQTDQWLRGGVNPSGDGRIPSIHPDDLGWSAQDIAIYLESGFTPEFDTAGGEMVDVVENMAQLPEADRSAIAAYLVQLD